MANKTNTRQKRKRGASVQALMGIKGFGEYGIVTNSGETVFFDVKATNITVLSARHVETKIRNLTLVLSAIPDAEILCTDSAECFDANKAYLIARAEKESNPKVKALLKKDAVFLDSVQTELTSARRFMIAVRCKNMKDAQVFDYANRVRKIICDQGFDAHRMTKAEIKRFLALYFDASLYGEQMPDVDGADNFNVS